MTDTQDISNDLSAWIDGELSDARAKQVAKAVQSDPALAAEADELRQVASLLSQFDAPALPDDFAQRIAAQAIPPKPSHFPRWASFCVAASVLIATGTALLIFQDNDMQQPSLAYQDVSKENRIAEAEAMDDDTVELKTEADGIPGRLKGRDGKLYTGKKDSDKSMERDLKACEELEDIRPAKPAARVPVASKTAGKKAGKYKGRIAKDAAPAEVLSPIASNPEPTRQIRTKAESIVARKGQDAGDAAANPAMGRAGPGRYDAAFNVDQARTEAQAVVTLMQNSLPVAQTVPGGPPGQKPIQFHAFRLNQRRQPQNREQTETVYVKSLEVGQQRVEGLFRVNGIELVKQGQPSLNTGQVVTTNSSAAAQSASERIKTKAARNTKAASRPASQVQYIVFGGQSQIKTLRSQVVVLNESGETAKLSERAAKQVESLAKQTDSSAQTETIPAPILKEDVKPTTMSSDVALPETEDRTRAIEAKRTEAKSEQQRRALSPPPVDVLIITVEERK